MQARGRSGRCSRSDSRRSRARVALDHRPRTPAPEEVMILSLERNADRDAVKRALTSRGLSIASVATAADETHIVLAECSVAIDAAELRRIPGVRSVAVEDSPHPKVDSQARIVDVAGIAVGIGAAPVAMGGPCSVESE